MTTIDTSYAVEMLQEALEVCRALHGQPLRGDPRRPSAERGEPGRRLTLAADLAAAASADLRLEYHALRRAPRTPPTPTGGVRNDRQRRR